MDIPSKNTAREGQILVGTLVISRKQDQEYHWNSVQCCTECANRETCSLNLIVCCRRRRRSSSSKYVAVVGRSLGQTAAITTLQAVSIVSRKGGSLRLSCFCAAAFHCELLLPQVQKDDSLRYGQEGVEKTRLSLALAASIVSTGRQGVNILRMLEVCGILISRIRQWTA